MQEQKYIILLDYQRGEGYLTKLKKLANVKKYYGKISSIKFLIKQIQNYLFRILAMIILGGSLVIALQRSRGVKIGKNVLVAG